MIRNEAKVGNQLRKRLLRNTVEPFMHSTRAVGAFQNALAQECFVRNPAGITETLKPESASDHPTQACIQGVGVRLENLHFQQVPRCSGHSESH